MSDSLPRGFLTNPAMRWLGYRGRTCELLEPLLYRSGRGAEFIVPSGFVTDFASVPKPFWNLISPFEGAKFPGILHDYLYGLRGWGPYFQNRAACDALFLEAMQLVGMGLADRRAVYRAVRLFGRFFSWGPNAAGESWRTEGPLDRVLSFSAPRPGLPLAYRPNPKTR